jgi:hypothetical protein
MTKRHGGTAHVQGQLNHGTRVQPASTSGGFHGGSPDLKKGTLKPVLSPASRQSRLATSYHGTVRK